jgi:trehalose 6-phosphate phosphatase
VNAATDFLDEDGRQLVPDGAGRRLLLRGADRLEAFLGAVRSAPGRTALFCDVDGTVSPIAPTPAEAVVPAATRALLERLIGALGLVAFVSGRDAATARRLVGIDGATYVGGHGLETLTADGRIESDPRAEPYVPVMRDLLARSRAGLRSAGVTLEDKHTIIGAHYRTAPDPAAALAAIDDLLAGPARAAGLRIATGHFMVEVQPPVDVGKGDAVRWLLDEGDYSAALFAGDDLTDRTGYSAVHDWAAKRAGRAACAVAAITDETPDEVRADSDVWVAATPGVTAVLHLLLTAGTRRQT